METSYMPHPTDLHSLSLSSIAHRCTNETERYFARQGNDPRYCFELFRRAILHRDELAWKYLYGQYAPLIAVWVRRHPAFSSTGEEAEDFVDLTLVRIWTALTPDKFAHFSNLASVLSYLKRCVNSVIVDAVRANERAGIDAQAEAVDDEGQPGNQAVEELALTRMQRQALWREIDARLHNEKERLVVYNSFVLALKPRQVYARHQDKFRDVNEVHRIKENVLARLRRDSTLKVLFGQDI
jgi:DNA-directed RNA polymerase specialized sigma24 family protein